MLSSSGVPREGTRTSIVDQRTPLTARIALVAGALFAFLAVWQTGVTYHAWHAIALFVVGVVRMHATDRRAFRNAGWLFVAGVVLFSGSLYALALGAPAWLGLATPFGGLAFIAGWLCVALGAASR